MDSFCNDFRLKKPPRYLFPYFLTMQMVHHSGSAPGPQPLIYGQPTHPQDSKPKKNNKKLFGLYYKLL